MECPVDGTKLEMNTVNAIKIEECPQCRGLWFEGGGLSKAKDESDPDLIWLDFDLWSDHESFSADWSSRKCPQCGKNMAAIAYAGTSVMVDYCPDGHGVWLGNGEFQGIIKALEAEVSSKNVSGYAASSLKQALELVTGDKGFASEWKDLNTVLRLLQYRLLAENPKVAELLIALEAANPFK